ncbi:MAG: HD domain-containing protein [Caldilineaceae bacterium]|nr:HD domain-containing protein [Caldilineaceae bacterium]
MDIDRYLTQAEVRQIYAAVESAHDFDHVLRVAQLGARIAQAEGADGTVVRLAALLHDAPAPSGERRDHHLAAAAFAGELLRQRGLAAGRVANVVHCIETHRFRGRTTEPATLEARCLYDADKLESIGAIGVARVFAYAGAHGNRLWTTPAANTPPIHEKPTGVDYTPVHEFVYKLERILPTFYTATAKTLGAQRHAYMLTFFEQLDAEMRGLA